MFSKTKFIIRNISILVIYLVQIGQQLSIVMIQRIIVCLLVLIVVIPLLDAQTRDMGLSIAVGLGYIEV